MANEQTRFTIGAAGYDMPVRVIDKPGVSELAFQVATEKANEYAAEHAQVMNDGFLSATGKEAKLGPKADALWRQIFVSYENIEGENLSLDARETALFSVGAATTANELSRDREVRDWFRGLPMPEQNKVVEQMKAGETHKEVVTALLRSPIPLCLDHLMSVVSAVHQDNRKAQFPEEAHAIESRREGVTWALRGMGFVVGIAHGVTDRKAAAVLGLAMSTDHQKAAELMFGEKAVQEANRDRIRMIRQGV